MAVLKMPWDQAMACVRWHQRKPKLMEEAKVRSEFDSKPGLTWDEVWEKK
jgi:hypothetical protein